MCGELECGPAVHSFGHPAFGVFGHDDGVVDQHADRQDQAEQDDDVDRVSGHRQGKDTHQERGRNGHADDDGGAARQGIENDDEDQDDGDQNVVLQIAEQGSDDVRLVLAEGDHGTFRQALLEVRREHLHGVNRVDEIGANALLDLDGDGGLAIEPGDGLGVLETLPDRGEIARANDRFRSGDDRQIGDVLDRFDQRGYAHREATFRALQRAGCNKAVAGIHALDHLIELQPIGCQLDRVDDDFDQFVPRALQ